MLQEESDLLVRDLKAMEESYGTDVLTLSIRLDILDACCQMLRLSNFSKSITQTFWVSCGHSFLTLRHASRLLSPVELTRYPTIRGPQSTRANKSCLRAEHTSSLASD
jgi:hypothetical protein